MKPIQSLPIQWRATVLLLSVFAFAVVAPAENGEPPPPFISGDPDSADGKKKKPTAAPGRGSWTATPGRGLLTPSPIPVPSPTPTPAPESTEFPFFPR